MNRQSPTNRAFIFLLTLVLSVPLAVAQNAPLQGFEEYVDKARAEWKVPGVAIAIVKDDKIVFAKGFGVRKLGDAATVDEHTMFAIGSATKAFTAAALAMLVDEGKIRWDDPVTKYLKDFQLYDPYVTRELTIRDLLCHRSGLDRAEKLWYGSAITRAEILRRLRYQKPAWSFRSHFGYNNLMYVAAGEIIPAVTGKTWEEFVEERIFAPLGMNATRASSAAAKTFANLATPHAKTAEKVLPIQLYVNDNVAAAGSIYSNVVDMAQWLRLQLALGSYGDKKLISLGAVKEMHAAQMNIPYESDVAIGAPDSHFAAYGFGWFLYDYHGVKLVRHAGNIDGMVAAVGMIPEEHLGVAVLSNLDASDLPTALMYRVFDAYLGLPAQDWSKRMLTVARIGEARRKAAARSADETRVLNTKPSLPLSQYAGTYRTDLYGESQITELPPADGRPARLRFYYSDGVNGELEHWQNDTFRLKWNGFGLGETFVTFTLNAQGKVDEMKVKNFDDFKRVR